MFDSADILKNGFIGLFLAFSLSVGLSTSANAQSGMSFETLHYKLSPFFAEELLGDIEQQLPQGSTYRIWGWDAGDFSGDGYNDVALSVRVRGDRGNDVRVYLFVDMQGYMRLVKTLTYQYVELPIEVGVVIRDQGIYVTRKYEQFHWSIDGYTFDRGALTKLDRFTTEKINRRTRETYQNFQSLERIERFIVTTSGVVDHEREYVCIPSLERGRRVYPGFATRAEGDKIKYVPSGAYYWEGPQDASIAVVSRWNSEFLYMSVYVTDDNVVAQKAERDRAFDHCELWIDATIRDEGQLAADNRILDSTVCGFILTPGDFGAMAPGVTIKPAGDLTPEQAASVGDITVTSHRTNNGWNARVRIPFRLLGFETAPVDFERIVELGCSAIAVDVDNEFRPQEQTEVATSDVQRLDPSTYGALLLVGSAQDYGSANNIYADDIAERLRGLGF